MMMGVNPLKGKTEAQFDRSLPIEWNSIGMKIWVLRLRRWWLVYYARNRFADGMLKNYCPVIV